MADPYDLERFVAAQASCYAMALAELRHGVKRSHWMWFVFPQIAGLGSSTTARHYAIESLDEARAYLDHPVLGPRLRESVDALRGLTDTTAVAVLGQVDAVKLRSSLTLFAAAGGGPAFAELLERWYGGVLDPATLALLATP